jgi:hypothetical protein
VALAGSLKILVTQVVEQEEAPVCGPVFISANTLSLASTATQAGKKVAIHKMKTVRKACFRTGAPRFSGKTVKVFSDARQARTFFVKPWEQALELGLSLSLFPADKKGMGSEKQGIMGCSLRNRGP